MGTLLALFGMSFYTQIETPPPDLDPIIQESTVRIKEKFKDEEPDQYAWLTPEPKSNAK